MRAARCVCWRKPGRTPFQAGDMVVAATVAKMTPIRLNS